MGIQIILYLLVLLTIISLAASIILFRKVKELKTLLAREKEKRLIPFLIPELDLKENKFLLRNNSACHAKDITIDDLCVTLHYGFDKTITLRFQPLNIIQANEKAELSFQLFDGERHVTSLMGDTIIFYIATISFKMQMHFSNIENMAFDVVVSAESGKFDIKEVKPAEPQD